MTMKRATLYDEIWEIISTDPGYNWPCIQANPFQPTRAKQCYVVVDKATREVLRDSATGKKVWALQYKELEYSAAKKQLTDKTMSKKYTAEQYTIVKGYVVQ